MKSKEAIAWDTWRASKEGVDSGNPISLGCESKMQQYLDNRLWRAFMAGLAAGKSVAAKEGK